MRRQARTSFNNPDNSRPARLASARGSFVTLAGVFTLASIVAVGCDEEDTTRPVGNGGNAGNAGNSGMAGSSGMGGSSGNAGNAGASGSAGMGGDGGASGSGGSGGDGGSAGDPDAGDGGPTDGGDGGPALDRTAVVTATCVKLDAVDACSPLANCVAAQLDTWDFFYGLLADCPERVDDYFVCISGAPQGAFQCNSDTPEYQIGNAACTDEENIVLGGTCP